MATHLVSRSVVVDAPAQTVFDILAAPHRHSEFDGSGSVKGVVAAAERLSPGARFGMDMVLGLPYRISNRVVEFEEGRTIAWRHFGPHRWRWELAPCGDGATRVTETFDYTRAPRGVYELLGFPARNARSIERTLPRLKRLAESA